MKILKYASIMGGVAQDVIGRKFGIDSIIYPLNISHIITKQCNFRCKMCNIGKGMHSPKEDMSLDQIEKFAQNKYLKKVFAVGLSGGEPFLRKDFIDIVKIYKKYLKNLQMITISTNGSLTDKILVDTRNILEMGLDVDIEVSMDGIGKEHEIVRNYPGCYELALKTIGELKNLKKEYDNLDIGLRFTILPSNYKNMIKVYDLAKSLNIGFVAKPAMTGGYFDNKDSDFSFTPEQKNEIITDIRKIVEREQRELELAKGRSIIADIKHISFIDFLDYSIRFITDPTKQIFPCYANFSSVSIENTGEIYTCLILYRKIGDLRKNSFDEIWQNKESREARKFIKLGKCACFTNCNQIPSLIISKFPKIMLKRFSKKLF